MHYSLGDSGPRMRDHPDPTLSEEELFHGYRDDPRTEPCACGRTITAPSGDPLLITLAVQNHQRTFEHKRWWRTFDA